MISEKQQRDFLLDRKWKKFLRLRPFFEIVPFVDFVLGSGSMALGDINANSDFDVTIGARRGRIFTVRFLTALVFELIGRRRSKHDNKENSKDKVCLNHFITENSYRLAPPHGIYWQTLYSRTVPIIGKKEALAKFAKANEDWIGKNIFSFEDRRYRPSDSNFLRSIGEFVLGGFIGDILEKFLKMIQLARIKKGLKKETGFKPRLRFDDEELEFHPDTSKAEKFNQKAAFIDQLAE
ncbi:MAG: hypothetical protein Q8L36_02825 [bacterium]|nr:hypothetical protein [bacterium]